MQSRPYTEDALTLLEQQTAPKPATPAPDKRFTGDSEPRARKHRLSRTLKRRLEFRPIEREDVRYLWAAYKKGSFAELDAFVETGMSAAAFSARLEAELNVNFPAAWTLFAQTKRGFLPVGLVLGFWSSPDPKLSPFMILGALIWFPWASPRTRIESAVNFFAKMRNEIPMVEHAREKDKKFFEMIARHGVMRRVGTMYNVYVNGPAAVFETRKS